MMEAAPSGKSKEAKPSGSAVEIQMHGPDCSCTKCAKWRSADEAAQKLLDRSKVPELKAKNPKLSQTKRLAHPEDSSSGAPPKKRAAEAHETSGVSRAPLASVSDNENNARVAGKKRQESGKDEEKGRTFEKVSSMGLGFGFRFHDLRFVAQSSGQQHIDWGCRFLF